LNLNSFLKIKFKTRIRKKMIDDVAVSDSREPSLEERSPSQDWKVTFATAREREQFITFFWKNILYFEYLGYTEAIITIHQQYWDVFQRVLIKDRLPYLLL
jgi:hypothetical protein